MGDKDLTEKTLEAYDDVFADIINVLLFNGKRLVCEKDLSPETAHSIYKADNKLHSQERDVAKYWKNGLIRLALFGMENQTDADADMPLRVISYDGAAYRNHLNVDKASTEAAAPKNGILQSPLCYTLGMSTTGRNTDTCWIVSRFRMN